ncbi:MAG: chemotaxis protein CheW [Thermotogota bacterium]
MAENTIRVNQSHVEELMDLVAELVISKSGLNQTMKDVEVHGVEEGLNQLNRITSDLQGLIMKMRMISIDNIFSGLEEVIDELNKESEKHVSLKIDGEKIEIDKTISEKVRKIIKDLITILHDNTDTEEERISAGKDKSQVIEINTLYEGNKARIDLLTDGKREIYLTDEIKKGIYDAKGEVDVEKVGDKDLIKIKLPMTLSIIQALLVKVDNKNYAIPVANIESTQKSADGDLKEVQDKEVFLLRGETIPLLRLRELFKKEKKEAGNIVIVNESGKKYGLFVDELVGQEDIVIKSMGKLLSDVKEFNGASILGNGEIALILDLKNLSEL